VLHPRVVLLGPPGAGKGTQAERLARDYGVPKISTGEILRDAVTADTEFGRSARETMAAGQLVGDEVMICIVRERLAMPDAAKGFVLDGFPRTVPQAQALEAMLAPLGPLTVLQVVVPTEELVRRLASRLICSVCGQTADPAMSAGSRCRRCGGTLVQRNDDSEDVARERLRVFEVETAPLIEHYQPSPTFFIVDGNQPPDEVAADMRAALRAANASRGSLEPTRANGVA
jgi:adenylate kinase